MYLLNTLLDEYRLPYMEKQQICEESVSIKNTEKLYEILNQYFKLGKRSEEYVYMAALDSRLNVIGFFEISHGTVNGSYFNNREIFMKALIAGAASIVLAHNHPSGDTSPSSEDLDCIEKIPILAHGNRKSCRTGGYGSVRGKRMQDMWSMVSAKA